ncbi:MAG: PAS domain S-box protein, partial [Thermoguttaceae bacterium]
MTKTASEIACLFPELTNPQDRTGALRTLGDLVAPLLPLKLLFLDDEGLIQAEEQFDCDIAFHHEPPLSELILAHIGKKNYCDFPLHLDTNTYCVFAVRLPLENDRGILAAVLPAEALDTRDLKAFRLTLALGGKLAWIAVKKAQNALELQTRVRHLCAEEVALKASHTEALNNAIQEREERMQLHSQIQMILDSAGEGIFGIDRQGSIIFANPAAAKMLGTTPEELLGKSAYDTLYTTPQDGPPRLRDDNPLYKTIHDGRIRRLNNESFWNHKGDSFPVQCTCTPICEKDEILGAVVTFADITERQLLEAQLAQAQKLESIGELAAGIA